MALSNRGIKALEEVGLAALLKETAIPMNGRMVHDISGNLVFLPYGKQGQFINSISRAGLNMVLTSEAEKLGAEFFFEHRCTSVDLSKTEITFQNHASTVHRSFDVIIGADGAFSAVRGSMQLMTI
jgi:kynurenine 3-monooxygenase